MYLFKFSILTIVLSICQGDESQFSINNNKPIQVVHEKFVSFSLDPAIFFAGLSNRPIILKLINNLTPAYLRIAGPSTEFLKFTTSEHKSTNFLDDESTSLTFSPPMWWSLNEWIQKINFTPIFAINDDGKKDEKIDPKKVLPLLDMTAKMNVNCLWQMGFDCTEKGFERYKEDLKTLRHMLDTFPHKKDAWQIIGSDLSKCTPSDHTEILRMYLADLQDADAIMWENDESLSTNFLGGDVMQKLLSFHQASLPIWVSTPKSEHPIRFEDGINWAVEMGEAARNGFNVIFREPRVQEYYSATPAYWVTVLHKNLMGRNVLDVKTSSLTPTDTYIYAHCSKDQNSYSVGGAMTVMIANNGSEPHKSAFRIPTQVKSVEVLSFILTTNKDNEMETYLNEEKLSLEEFNLQPKFRRAKILTHLTLTVPEKSIAFFVLPGAKIPICIDNEDDTDLILKEIDKIQEVDFPDATTGKSTGLFSRLNTRTSLTLADLHRRLENEFKTDAALIPKLKLKSATKSDERKMAISSISKDKNKLLKTRNEHEKKPTLFDNSAKRINDMKNLLEKAKTDVKPLPLDLKNLLGKDKDKEERKDEVVAIAMNKPKLGLDLSSAEVLKILGDRAKAKLERRVGLADFDFFEKALKGRFKRDINMALLEEKVHDQEHKPLLPTLVKKKKKITTTKAPESESEEKENKRLPDMSKIIPGFAEKTPKQDSLFGKAATKQKIDLFNIEPLDFSSLFSLLGSKTLMTTTSTTEKSTSFNNNKNNNNGYEDFLEHFGDSVSIKPKKQHEFHDLGAAWDFDDDGFLDNEFVINDDRNIPDTIEKLENYFNHQSRFSHQGRQQSDDEYFEPAFDSFEHFGRFKRNINLFKFIQAIKSKQRQRERERQRNSINKNRPTQRKSAPLFKKSLFTRNADETRTPNNEISQPQKAYLKARLVHHRLLQSNDLSKKLSAGNGISLLDVLRPPRSIKDNEKLYVTKSNITNKILKSYESKLNGKEWRPEDMLSLPPQHAIFKINERNEQVAFNDIPTPKRAKINSRNARHVDGDINSIENTLDGFLNAIEKDERFIKPLLEKESGEYTIVFPSRDKISLKEDNSKAEIVLHHEKTNIESKTCPATDFDLITTTTTTINPLIKLLKAGRVDRSEYVQKIPPRDKNKSKQPILENVKNNFVKTIVNGFNKFMKRVQQKVTSFFNNVE